MKSTIYKLKKATKWTLSYEYPDERVRKRKTFKTKREAQVYLEIVKNDFIQEQENYLSTSTVGELLDFYLIDYPCSNILSNRTRYNLFYEKFKDIKFKSMTVQVLEDWFKELEKEYCSKSLSNFKIQLKGFFTYLIKYGYIERSPLEQLIIKTNTRNRNKLSPKDMNEILEAMFYLSPYFLYRFFLVMYQTGMTVRELVELKWEHINEQEKRVNVINPKVGHVRSVVVSSNLLTLLSTFPRFSEYVLVNRYQKKIDPNLISRHLIRLRERFPKIKNFNCDDIRNAYGFHFKGSTELLSKNLGHRNFEYTGRYFGRP